jgi:hypothetical protein
VDSSNELDYEVVIKGTISGIPPEMLNQYFQQSITFTMNMAKTVQHVDINLHQKSRILKPEIPIT